LGGHRLRWDGSTAIITGASRGIGAATAVAAAARGARVGLIARDEGDLQRVLASTGGAGAYAVADVSDGPAVAAAIARLEGELGPTDILVANAGIGQYGAFADVTAKEVEQVIRVNVLGQIHALRAVVPGMIERRRGHLVSMGSIAGRIGTPFESVYAASKFANVGLAEALVTELGPYEIGVSIINPGPVATEFGQRRGHVYDRPRPRPVPADDVARAVIEAVERGQLERYVPAMLRPAVPVRHLLPRLFRWGTARSMRRELAHDQATRAGGAG
jgi:short-subunit dehydrogenase